MLKPTLFSLLLAAAVILLAAGIFSRKKIIDFHLHDTMFVIGLRDLFFKLSLLLFLIWAIKKLFLR